MNLRIGRFWSDERGTSFEGIALSVSIIAVAFVASADMLDYMTKGQDKLQQPTSIALRRTVPLPGSADLDTMPTASLPKLITRSVLDPCTGQTK